ncbi:hypothetical protein B9Z55_006205 [Caenorhabditis nigoni]|uniref:Uncharacterized protein n=1 Tax=Caenorhabditis nigoni TaxID=1611254 RepID=A0A2G5V4J1_9PELO|nr:hypothetical protein B9Z55_006205 [Caenorhabditis nigoni]
MTTPDSDSIADPFGGSDPPSAPLTFRAPPVSNCAKSIIDRKLRKYASETSFATETASESSLEREVPSRSRVFTVKPVGTRTPGGIVLTNGASNSNNSNNGGVHRSRRRHDSDASGSANSEATVASGANTPRRCHFRRPKSTSEMHQSCTSATIHSLESHHNEERRASHVYMIDDDSVHEFEDDDEIEIIEFKVNGFGGLLKEKQCLANCTDVPHARTYKPNFADKEKSFFVPVQAF